MPAVWKGVIPPWQDFAAAFVHTQPSTNMLFDVTFLVGQGRAKKKLWGVRAILGVRSRVFQEMLYGISTVFGSPQVKNVQKWKETRAFNS